MNKKIRQDLIHDINAVFIMKASRIHADGKWINVELDSGYEITMLDFPHLLTIAKGYNVRINIYPVTSNQLGVFFKEVD